MADSDPRSEEIELLQAMYSGDGEFTMDDTFSFTLHLEADPARFDVAVTLLEDYPAVRPEVRVMCYIISRDANDELMRGLDGQFEEWIAVGEPYMTVLVGWLQENAPGHMVVDLQPEPSTTVVEPERKSLRHGAKCVMWEERGDLFDTGTEWALCHCVSKDLDMSAGIAVDFKKKFGGVPVLKSQQIEVGGVGVLEKKGRFIYYLVTKNKHGGKPTMVTLEASLRAMRELMMSQGVKKLAMPHIGCGLDHLSWGAVSELVVQVFDEVDVEILARAI